MALSVLLSVASSSQQAGAQIGERSITLYNIHSKETKTIVFKRGGRYVEEGLKEANWMLRDWRRNETTRMDPALVDLLWEIHRELGSKAPIHIISGYRSRATNEMLRRTVGGQASQSRHILGKAADVHFPDVPLKNLRYSALIHERGGVGYYPTSAIPFVHIDTDRVRSWPRLPRHELALLFPSGSTKHMAADGGHITKADVRVAQAKYNTLATQIAAFHQEREGGPRATVAVASLEPQDKHAPRASERHAGRRQVASLAPDAGAVGGSQKITTGPVARIQLSPSKDERAKLAELASLASTAPRLVVGPRPARRPERHQALPSLTQSAVPIPGVVQVGYAPGPRVAALAPADLPNGSDIRVDAPSIPAGWSIAPAYDEEHPDELSYRPFPIAPYMTASANEAILADLVRHDVARTIDLIDQPGTAAPLRFRPTPAGARPVNVHRFSGNAIRVDRMDEARRHVAGTQ
ncbi:MAG: DUF882 domain-containing protein [Hyphomicrobiaceae bacterium]